VKIKIEFESKGENHKILKPCPYVKGSNKELSDSIINLTKKNFQLIVKKHRKKILMNKL